MNKKSGFTPREKPNINREEKGYQPRDPKNEGYTPTTSEHQTEKTPQPPKGGSGKSD